MKITCESNMWIDVKFDEDGDLVIETSSVDGDVLTIYTRNKKHICQFIVDVKKLKCH